VSIRVTKTTSGKKRYAARVHTGGGKYKLLPTRDTRQEARKDEARWELERSAPEKTKTKDFADRWLTAYKERTKISSQAIAEAAIKHWLKDFGSRSIQSITREEAQNWSAKVNERTGRPNRWACRVIVTLMNEAVDEGLIDKNPFKGTSPRSRGRRDKQPLTPSEVEHLAKIAGKESGATFEAFVLFGAYSGMRVGEMYALTWDAIDFNRNRIVVKQRFYGSDLDIPKGNKPKEITLLPEARDALMGLDRSTDWVFVGKTGKHLSQSMLAYHWKAIKVGFGRNVTPHELRHFCAHYLYVTRGYPARVVAAQLTHSSPSLVEDNYGHGDVGALEEIERTYSERSNVFPLRKVSGE
jgi:integrase